MQSINQIVDFLKCVNQDQEDWSQLNKLSKNYFDELWQVNSLTVELHKSNQDIVDNQFLQNKYQNIFKKELDNQFQKVQSTLPSFPIVKEKMKQEQHRLNRVVELKSKIILKKNKIVLDEINLAINQISGQLVLAEKYQCHPLELVTKDAAAVKADQMMELLIQEEKQNSKKSQKSKKVKNKQQIRRQEQSENIKTKKCVIQQTFESKLTLFVLNLQKGPSTYLEHPRVKRWRTTQIHTIRAFTDIDALGQKVLRYKDFTEEEIAEQRARHFLPGTERLLKDSCYRHIYTFSTDRGVGMIAQFIFKQIIHNGVLYLGIDEKKPLIFHKYFEDVDFKDSTNNVFSDNEKVKNETDTEEDAIEEWNSQDEYNLDISKNGVLKFSYSDHELHVFPIRQDLFEKTLH